MSDLYFGTKRHSQWVRNFAPGITYQPVGYEESLQFLNGGIGMRQSFDAHMEYTLTWPNTTRDRVRAITDYSTGIYGTGLVYWLDSMAMDRNLFNLSWGAPGLATLDAVPIIGDARPEQVLNGDQSLGYPAVMARYSVTAGDVGRSFYIPVPSGYTAWIGAHGTAQAIGLSVQPTVGGVVAGASTSIPVLDVDDSNRMTHSFAGGDQYGLQVSLDTSATGTITLAGLMAQVLPTGRTPETGGYISGQGNSGCRMSRPTITPYLLNPGVANMPGAESVGLAAKLTEVGDWL